MLPVLVKDSQACGRCHGALATLEGFDALGRGVWRWCPCMGGDAPAAGHPAYLALLAQMGLLHSSKSADYGTDKDVLSNLRAAEDFGVENWRGALVRMNDKVSRVKSFAQKGALKNEPFEDALVDNAAYSLLALVLYCEEKARSEAAKNRVGAPPLLSGESPEPPPRGALPKGKVFEATVVSSAAPSVAPTAPSVAWDAYLRAAHADVVAGGDGGHDPSDDDAGYDDRNEPVYGKKKA